MLFGGRPSGRAESRNSARTGRGDGFNVGQTGTGAGQEHGSRSRQDCRAAE